MSAPVLASFRLGSPVDHVPLGVTESGEIVGSGRQPLSMSDEWGKEIVRKKEVRCSES